ncbi:MAG: GGDEF domain-containing protein [Lachnospiraceae bacterium]|nr:GGDEF domain-containing protein [Lachnospiraceae bacterium]
MDINSDRIEELKQNILATRLTDPKGALSLCYELERMSTLAHDDYSHAFAECYIGTILYALNRIDEVMILFESALPSFHSGGYYLLEAKAYIIMGLAFGSKHDHITSLDYFMTALEISKRYGFYLQSAVVCNNISILYTKIGDYRSACKQLRIAISYCTKLEDGSGDNSLRLFIMNLTFNLLCLKHFDEAEEVLSNLVETPELLSSEKFTGFYYYLKLRMAYHHENMEEFNRLLPLTVSALKSRIALVDQILIYTELSKFLLEIGDFDNLRLLVENIEQKAALYSFNRSLAGLCEIEIRYYKAIGDKEKLARAYMDYYSCCVDHHEEMRHNNALAANMFVTLNNIEREQKSLESQRQVLIHRSEYDALTKLPNRSRLKKHTDSLLSSAQMRRNSFCIILMDVDCFKQYNDTYGHIKGDQVLRSIGNVLRSVSDTDAEFYRYGGDEFLGVAKGKTDEEIEQLLSQIESQVLALEVESAGQSKNRFVTITAGFVNRVPKKEDTLNLFINEADESLYRNKASWKRIAQNRD